MVLLLFERRKAMETIIINSNVSKGKNMNVDQTNAIKEFMSYLLGELFTEFLYSQEVERFIDKHKYKESVHDIEHFLKMIFKGEAKSSSEEINNLANNYRQLLYAEVTCLYVDYFGIKGGKHLTIEDIKKINELIRKELKNL